MLSGANPDPRRSEMLPHFEILALCSFDIQMANLFRVFTCVWNRSAQEYKSDSLRNKDD